MLGCSLLFISISSVVVAGHNTSKWWPWQPSPHLLHCQPEVALGKSLDRNSQQTQ